MSAMSSLAVGSTLHMRVFRNRSRGDVLIPAAQEEHAVEDMVVKDAIPEQQ